MDIKPRKPQTAFDFGIAVTLPFRSADGRGFLLRLAGWMTVFFTLVYVIIIPFVAPTYGEMLEYNWLNMQATFGGGTPPDPNAMLGSFVKLIPAYIAMTLGMWIVLASGEAALHRKFLRREEASKLPLRFGGDELRVMLTQLGVWVVVFLVYMLGVVLIALVGGLLARTIPLLGIIIAGLSGLALFCFLIFLPVRLAPAAALSVERRKTHLLAANKITKHRFWWLFLSYLVVAVGGYVVIYAVGAICAGIATGDIGFMMAMTGFGSENPKEVFEGITERFSNPIYWVLGIVCLAIYSFVFCLWYLCLAGIGTYAVNWWQAEDPMSQFD